jgi:hypothetical protein
MARKPKYIHDCKECHFLGTLDNTFDLYFCDKQGKGRETVIARYGDKGADYLSGMNFATKDGLETLYEAKKRAIKLKLYNPI